MAGGDVPEIVLARLDEPRREFLRKLVLGSAFVVPAVASFSMTGLSVDEAHAQVSNVIPTPEPASAALLGTAVTALGVAGALRRGRKRGRSARQSSEEV